MHFTYTFASSRGGATTRGFGIQGAIFLKEAVAAQAWSGSVREKYPFEGPEAPRIREKYQAGLQAAVSYSQNTVLAAQNTE